MKNIVKEKKSSVFMTFSSLLCPYSLMLDAQNVAPLPRRLMGPTRGPEGPLNQNLLILYICNMRKL
jgi:hypothetical protein